MVIGDGAFLKMPRPQLLWYHQQKCSNPAHSIYSIDRCADLHPYIFYLPFFIGKDRKDPGKDHECRIAGDYNLRNRRF